MIIHDDARFGGGLRMEVGFIRMRWTFEVRSMNGGWALATHGVRCGAGLVAGGDRHRHGAADLPCPIMARINILGEDA